MKDRHVVLVVGAAAFTALLAVVIGVKRGHDRIESSIPVVRRSSVPPIELTPFEVDGKPEPEAAEITASTTAPVPWSRIPYMVRFAGGNLFSTRMGSGFGTEYICLDIGGQTRLLGMSAEASKQLILQIRGVQRIDTALLQWAGVEAADGRTGIDTEKVEPRVLTQAVSKLVALLEMREPEPTLRDRIFSVGTPQFEPTSQAVTTRAILLLGELDADLASLEVLKPFLESDHAEHAAAAAVAFAKAGHFVQIQGRLESAGSEMQVAFLSAFKWGVGGGGEIDLGGSEKFGFTTNDPRRGTPDQLREFAVRVADSSSDVTARAAAAEILMQFWGEQGVEDRVRRMLLAQEEPAILNALLWHRQAYYFASDPASLHRLMNLSKRGEDWLAVAATHRLCGSREPVVVQYLAELVLTAQGPKLNATLNALTVNGHVLREPVIRALQARMPHLQDKDLREAASRAIKTLQK